MFCLLIFNCFVCLKTIIAEDHKNLAILSIIYISTYSVDPKNDNGNVLLLVNIDTKAMREISSN